MWRRPSLRLPLRPAILPGWLRAGVWCLLLAVANPFCCHVFAALKDAHFPPAEEPAAGLRADDVELEECHGRPRAPRPDAAGHAPIVPAWQIFARLEPETVRAGWIQPGPEAAADQPAGLRRHVLLQVWRW